MALVIGLQELQLEKLNRMKEQDFFDEFDEGAHAPKATATGGKASKRKQKIADEIQMLALGSSGDVRMS